MSAFERERAGLPAAAARPAEGGGAEPRDAIAVAADILGLRRRGVIGAGDAAAGRWPMLTTWRC